MFLALLIITSQKQFAQADPAILLDGVKTVFKSGLSLPYWIKASQTIELTSTIKSISILEFEVKDSNLIFSQVLSVNSNQTVPANKVWKIEAFGLDTTTIYYSTATKPALLTSPKVFSTVGSWNWAVPPGVTNICVEVWGGGGNGGSGNYPNSSAGGGGGGYGYQCFVVIPGTVYLATVGNVGGTTSLGELISATGGSDANLDTPGLGGTSTATFNITGSKGGYANGTFGGNGGSGANGGAGAIGVSQRNPVNGIAPGGGGAGASQFQSQGYGSSAGGIGQLLIYW
jgi:hypothetical protein